MINGSKITFNSYSKVCQQKQLSPMPLPDCRFDSFSFDFLFLIRHFSPVRLNALAGIANQRKKCDHYTIKFILNFIVQLYRSGHTDFKLEFLVTCMPLDPTLASHHGKGYQELTATPGMLACQQGGFHTKVSVAISTTFRLIIGLSFLEKSKV